MLIPEQSFTSFGIVMVDLHSPTAPTIARKVAARTARGAYEKRKTRQVAATTVVRAASVTRAAPALSLSVQPLNRHRVAARVPEMPRGPLSEDEVQHREAPSAVSASDRKSIYFMLATIFLSLSTGLRFNK